MNPSLDLTERFIKGLKDYNLTADNVKNGNWKYCGGDSKEHLNYFKLCFPMCDIPDKEEYCICGHKIRYNCYITDDNEIIVLGNCCIKKFITKNTRSCSVCSNTHSNRIINKCNTCRLLYCRKCDKRIYNGYRFCYRC